MIPRANVRLLLVSLLGWFGPYAVAALSITQQPASLSVTVGAQAQFTVVATGTGTLTYLWQRNGFPLVNQTTATLTLAQTALSDADTYNVVVTDTTGSTPSAAARLGVAPIAYPGALKIDSTFNLPVESDTSGSLTTVVPYLFNGTSAVNQFIAAGDFIRVAGNSSIRRLARFNAADGSLDTSFAANVNFTVSAVLVQPDGKVVAGGNYNTVNGQNRVNLVRLNPDGSVDPTFNATVNSTILAIARQPDGKLIVAGSFTTFFNGSTVNRVARLNADGSTDATWLTGSTQGVTGQVNAVAVDPVSLKVVLGGAFTAHADGTALNRIARFNTDGSRDTTFPSGAGTGFDNTVNALAFDGTTSGPTAGAVLVGGAFTAYGGAPGINRLVRLTSAGARDTTFNYNLPVGTGYTSAPAVTFTAAPVGGVTATATAVFSGGQITAINITNPGSGYTATPTITISGGGGSGAAANATLVSGAVSAITLAAGPSSTVNALAYESASSRWLVGGAFTSYNGSATFNRVIRLGATGALDPSFNPNVNNTVSSLFAQSDGAVVLGGSFSTVGGQSNRMLARVSAAGARDSAVNPGFRVVASVNTLLPLPGGKYLVGGSFTHLGTTPTQNLARLNSDLTLDQTFAPPGGSGYTSAPSVVFAGPGTGAAATAVVNPSNGQVSSIAITNGGTGYTTAPTVTITGGGGSGATATATVASGVVTGVTLTAAASGPNGAVVSAALQGDGKIVIGGAFNSFSGATANRLARLTSGLTLDASFNSGTGPNGTVNDIALLPGGPLYIGGDFSSYNSAARAGVARVNGDGTIDLGFNAGAGSFSVNSIAVQPADGKVVVGGNFTTVNTAARSHIVRLNTDGTFDSAFPTAGANGQVRAVELQPDGQILIGGDFTAYNGTTINRLARLNAADGTLDGTFATGTMVSGTVNQIVRQEDAKVLAYGNFATSVAGAASTRHLARFAASGSFDLTAHLQPASTGSFITTSQISALRILENGSVLVGSHMLTMGGVERNGLIRLTSAATLPVIASLSASSVRAGDTLTITGSGFTDVFGVRFNGPTGPTATTFTVNSPTSITVTVPPTAISGPVTVQTVAGNGSSAAVLGVAPDFRLRNPATTASSFEAGLAYGNGMYVAATLSGALWSSPNGVDWTQTFSGPNGFNGVAFAAGQFTAVGNSGTILTSTNGTSWTQRILLTTTGLNGVTHDGTRWLVVTTGTTVVTSTNGTDWTFFTSTGGGSANAVAFGAGLFVSASSGGVIRTSSDNGVTWLTRTANAGTNNLNDVAFLNNQFVAVGNSGTLITSPDGIVWTARTSNAGTTNLHTVAYGAGTAKYIVGSAGGTNGYLSSTDNGVTWVSAALPTGGGGSIRALVFADGRFVGAGSTGSVFTSTDGSTWILRQSVTNRTMRDIAHGNGRYVIVSNSSAAFATSTDGVTWTAGDTAAGSTSSLNAVAYGNGLFVAVGSNLIATTTDGMNWVNRTPAGSFTFNGISFGGGVFVAVANTGLAYRSTDGVNWTPITSTGTTSNLTAVAYGAGMFTAVGAAGAVTTSADLGLTWSATTSGTAALNAIRYANGQFVVVGASSTVLTSQTLSAPAALTFTPRTLSATGQNLTGLAYGDGYFVAVGTSSAASCFVSLDAISWTTVTPAADAFSLSGTNGIIYGNGRFVTGGFGGVILSTNPASDTLIIATQPVATTTVAPGATASLTVSATGGTSPSYQWYSGSSGDTSNPVSGATSATFTTPAISSPRTFWVRVSSGTTVVDSATARVAATAAAPVISAHPVDLDRTAGQSASFTFAASGNGALTTQWLRNGVAIPGANSGTFSISSVSRADADYYSVAISDAFGNTTVSNAARLSVAPAAYAQASVIDGAYAHLYERAGGTLNRVLLQADGKLVVAGDFSRVGGVLRTRLARFNTDGTHDTDFTPPFLSVNINALAQDASGKLLVGGDFYDVAGDSRRNRLVRLNANGTLDTTFNPGGSGPTSTVNVIRVLGSGQILIGGFFGSYNGSTVGGLARLNSNGTLDPGFTANLGSNVSAMAVQSDGRILVGGNFTTVNGFSRNRLARLHGDGSLDPSFNPGSGPAATVSAIALDATGILIGGSFTSYNGVTANRIARVLSSGALDPSFFALGGSGYTSAPAVALTGGGGSGASSTATFNSTTGQVTGFTINSGGSGYTSAPTVTLSGGGGSGAAAIAVVTGGAVTSITLNTSTGAQSTVNDIVVQPDNKIIIGGAFTNYGGTAAAATRLARLLPTGVLDTTFATGTGVNSTVTALALKLDGSNNVDGVFVGGSFTTVNTTTSRPFGLARLTSAGAIDTTVNPVGHRYGGVLSVTPLPAGKLLVAGDFSQIDGVARGGLAKLEANGSLDAGFNTGAGANGAINAAHLQADGKLVIVGGFTTFNGAAVNRIARLSPDASVDASFSTGGGVGSAVGFILPQPDGKLIIGGNGLTTFTYAGVTRNGLVRLNPDGTADTSFVPPAFGSTIDALALQRDGKVLVGGAFTTVAGAAQNRLVRLNADGSADTAFNTNLGTGASGTVNSITVQNDGKILIGGAFTTFNGASRTRILRLDSTGLVDSSFDAGTAVTGTVSRILVQENGAILLRGGFSFGLTPNVNANSIVRLTATGALDTSFAGYGLTNNNSQTNQPLALADDGTVFAGGYLFMLVQGTDYTGLLHLKPGAAPVITTPLTDQVAALGGTVTFTVGATGSAPLTFVWFKNGVVIPGATTSSITRNNLTPEDEGHYSVSVNNALGFANSAARLRGANPEPTVTVPLAATTFATAGGGTTLSVTATGTGTLAYQWFRNGQQIPGANSSSYTISSVTPADAGSYGVRIIDGLSQNGSETRVEVRPATYPGALRLRTSFAPKFEQPGNVISLAVRADGSFYGVGTFNTANDTPRLTVARFLAGGSLDTAFTPVPISGGNTNAIVVQPDGKVIVGGGFTTVAGVDRPYIVRLDATGAVDSSFNPGPGFNASVSELALQSDGALIVSGNFSAFNGAPASGVARLTSSGSLDTSFSAGTSLTGVSAVAIQSDGKIVLGGSFTAYSSANGFAVTTGRIVRLNPNGSFDSTFNAGLGFDNTVNALAIQPDGRILAGGAFVNYAGAGANRIARLNSDGTLDPTFAIGTGFNSTVSALRLLSDGSVLAGGVFTSYKGTLAFRLARLSSVGALDAAFNTALGAGITTTAPGTTANVGSLALQSDGSILLGGTFTAVNNAAHVSLARISAAGVVDDSFNPSVRTSGTVISMVPLPDGSWLAGGLFTHVDNVPVGNLAKLSAAGALDTTFNASLGAGFNSAINVILPQPGGKFLLGGLFTSFNGVTVNRIARLNGNGTLDPSFVSGAGFNSTVGAMLQDAGGAITVGGNFTSYDGQSYNRIIRLTADGAIDQGFWPGAGFNGFVTALARRAGDERLVVAGNSFTSFDGVARANIARLNSGGSLDLTFVPPTTMPTLISSLIVLPDDRVLVGGSTTSFSSDQPGVATVNVVARLRADGSLDTDFAPQVGNFFIFSGTTTTSRPSLALQADGRILVSGVFAGANGELRGGLARLNANGTTDPSFGAPLLAVGLNNSHSLPLVYGADGALYVGGLYFNFPDRVLGGLAAFEPSTPALAINVHPTSKSILAGQSVSLSVAAVGTGSVTYQWKQGGLNLTDTIGRIAGSTTALLSIRGAQAADAGNYTVTVTDSSGSIISNPASLTVATSAPVATVGSAFGAAAQTTSGTVITATLSAGTAPITYQWTRNGVDIPGATGTSSTNGPASGDRIDYVATLGWKSSDAGDYAIRLTNAAGTFTSNPVRVGAHDDGIWTFHNQYPSSHSLQRVFTLNNQFLGFGGRGGRYVSTDGVAWTQLPSIGTITHHQYLVANGRHYIWGSRFYIDSPDGITWTSRTTGLGSEAFSLAYGNGVFVSAAADGSVLRSTNGREWSVVTFGNASNSTYIDEVTFGNGAFVLFNGYGAIFRSTDGLTWAPQTAPAGLILRESRFLNGQFVAFGDKGALATSPDGINWTARNSGITGDINYAYYANATYVLAADGRVLTSSDLVNWTPRPIPGAVQPRGNPTPVTGIAYLNGTWVAASTSLYTSPNLTDWTVRNSTVGSFQQFNGVAAGSGHLVAVGAGGVIARSDNGTAWSDQISPTLNSLNDLLYANGAYTAAGNAGTILRSVDGVAWTSATSGTNNLTFVTLRNGLYLTGGAAGTLLRSTDGLSWSSVASGLAIQLNSAAFNAGRTVVVGINGAIRTTDDDLAATTTPTWITRMSGTIESLTRVIYANNLFVAVGSNGTILASTDGAIWTSRGYPTPDDYNNVTLTGGVFVVTGGAQTVSLSVDGLTWAAHQTGYNGRLFAATTFNNRVVAVGAGSTILSAGLAPAIAQPPGAQSIAVGQPINLRVIPAASVLPLTYQWSLGGSAIDGATSATLSIPAAQFTHAGSYRVTISAAGQPPVTSAPATVTVGNPTLITQHPASQTILPGTAAEFTVVATGTAPFSYQWRKVIGTEITNIPGATSATYRIPAPVTADAGVYSVVVSTPFGSATSNNATLSIPTTPIFVDQPVSRRAVAGGSVKFAASAVGTTPLTYQWRKGSNNITGATGTTLTLNNLTAADADTYTLVATNASSESTTSAAATLTVLPADNVLWQQFTEFSTEHSPARTIHDGAGKVYLPWSVQDRNPDMVAGKLVGALARFNEADGTLDPSFQLDRRYRSASHVVVLPDGKLLVSIGLGDAKTIIRTDATGAVDPSFNAPLFARGIRFFSRQADGKLVVGVADGVDANAQPSWLGAAAPSVFRLLDNGALDASFQVATLNSTAVLFGPPVFDSAGRIYLVGGFGSVNGTARINIARLLPTGALDDYAAPATLPAGFASSQARGISFQADGRAVVIGDFRYTGRGTSGDRIMAIRLNAANGALDTTYGMPLLSQLGFNPAIAVRARYSVPQAGDALVVVSDRLVRITAAGTLDPTFVSRAFDRETFWLSQAADGRLFVPDVGSVSGKVVPQSLVGNGIAVFAANGTPDHTFQTGGFGRSAVATSGVVLPDGRVAVAGDFNRAGVTPVAGIALYEAGGNLAAAQASPSHSMQSTSIAAADGNQLFAIINRSSNSIETGLSEFVRGLPGVGQDASFVPVLPANYSLPSATLYAAPGGKVMLAQGFVTAQAALNGETGDALIRLNANGSRDTTYTATLSAFAVVERATPTTAPTMIRTGGLNVAQVLPDGSALIIVSAVDGTVKLQRLTPAGTIDTSFNAPSFGTLTPTSGFTNGTTLDPVTNTTAQFPLTTYSASDLVRTAVQAPDGKVYVGGRFALAGAPRGLVRLNADGSLDATFTGAGIAYTKTDAGPYVTALAVDYVHRVYAAGRFDSFNGTVNNGLFRLNRDGTLDTAWTSPVTVVDAPRATVRLSAIGPKLYAFGTVASAGDLLPASWRVADITSAPIILGFSPSIVVAGATVTLRGAGFTGATTVQFNGVNAASFSVVSDVELTAVVPTLATTGPISVTVSAGGVISSEFSLTVHRAPTVTIAPAAPVVIAGTSVTFTATVTGNPTPTLQWRKAGNPIADATSATYTIPNAQPGDTAQYSVVATNIVSSATATADLTVHVAPVITQHPVASLVVTAGQSASFTVAATGIPTPTFQWFKGADPIPGATNATFTIDATVPTDDATYHAVATNVVASAPSTAAVLTVNFGPVITSVAANQAANLGGTASFLVTATGKPALTYQWRRDTTVLTGQTQSALALTNISVTDAGTYTVTVANSVNSLTHTAGVLTLNPGIASFAPATATPGVTVTLQGVGFTGATAVKFNGLDAASFTVVSDTQITAVVPLYATSGLLSVTLAGGSNVNSAAPITISQGTRIVSQSIRGTVGTGENALLANFTIEGHVAKSVLVRAVGPGLVAFGVPGALVDPLLTIHDATGAIVASNDNWGGATAIVNAAAAAGAFNLSASSKDAAILASLAPGTYTARVSGVAGGTGEALLETYETAATGRLAHAATRTRITTSATTGFVLGGVGATGTKTVLIRAVGTGLGTPGAVANPTLSVFGGSPSALIASNDNFGDNANLAAIATATAAVGAMPLAANDSALLLTLEAGAYTVQVGGGTGLVMTEVFLVDGYRADTAAPALLAPLQDQTLTAGATITLAAPFTAKPATVTFQWKKNGNNIATATGQTFTIASAVAGDAGNYSVAMTSGGVTTTSAEATLGINVLPSITTDPVAQTVVAGQSATFTAAASGFPDPTYQWRRNGLNLPGATHPSLTLTNVSFDAGGNYSVVATNIVGFATSANALLTVNPIAPVVTSPGTASGVLGRTFSYQITTSTTQATYSATGLPSGLTVDATSGNISGIPTATGTFNATVSASNVTGSNGKPVTITILPPPPIINSAAAATGRVGTAFTFTVLAVNMPAGSTFAATGLPANLTIDVTTGIISGTPAVAGTFNLALSATNATGTALSTLQLTFDPPLNVPAYSGPTQLSAVQGAAFSFVPVFANGVTGYAATGLPANLGINAGTGVISGTASATGTFAVTLAATNAGGTTHVPLTITVNPAPTAPVISSASTATATVGSPFSFTLTASQSPTSFAATGLPGVFTLDATSGVITGTPTAPGQITAQVRAANGVGSGPQSVLLISVNPAANAPIITSAPVIQGRVGDPFAFTLTASNAPTSFALTSGTLPAGLVFDGATGALTGTPTQVGQRRVWFAATNATGQGLALEILFSIAAADTTPVINSNGTVAGQVGQPFSYVITATNGPTSFAVASGTLPTGLTLAPSTGIISGIPSEARTAPAIVTLTATNATSTSSAKSLSLTIAPAPATPIITSALTAAGRAGSAFAYTVTASESATSFVASNLPAGLVLDSITGVITGTPTVSGTFNATLRAANAAGLGTPSTLVVTVAAAAAAPSITSAAAVSGKVGATAAFLYQITTSIPAGSGAVTAYGLTGTLPLGLSFNTSTGAISGRPAESGIFTVLLTATNDGGSSQPQSLVLNIAPADNVPVITSGLYASATVGQTFTYTITAASTPAFPAAPFPAPFTLDAVNLPEGLAVNPSTGVIQGVPTTAGIFTATLVGTNGAGTGPFRDLTIFVQPAPTAPVVTSTPSAAAQVGTSFSYQITGTNSPTSFEVLGAPAWMTVNGQNGAVAGTPTTPGSFTVQLIAGNAAGTSNPLTLTLTVAPAANTPVITSSRNASGKVSVTTDPQPFSYQIMATNTPTSYVATGLPGGLSLNATTGLISGHPNTSGQFEVTLIAVNDNGTGQPVTLIITIAPNVTFVF